MHFSKYSIGWSTLLLYLSLKSPAAADTAPGSGSPATPTVSALSGATVVTGQIGTQTSQETFVPTVYSQYASLSSFVTLTPSSVSGTSIPPVVVGTGGVAWAPLNPSAAGFTAPSVLPSVAPHASGSPSTTIASSISSTSGGSSSPSSASSTGTSPTPLAVVTTSFDPAPLTVGSVDPTVTANTAIKTSDDHHPVGLYPFIKGGPSCFFCPPGIDNGGFFLFGMNRPGIFPPPPTPPFPGVRNFPTITIDSNLNPTADSKDQSQSKSKATNSPATSSASSSASSSTTSSASSSASPSSSSCSGPQAWSNVVDGDDYQSAFSSVPVSTSAATSSATSTAPTSSTPPPPPPPSTTPPPPPPPSSTPAPSSSTPAPPPRPPPPPPPPPQMIQCDKGEEETDGIGAAGPAGGLGNTVCSCMGSSTNAPNDGCCDGGCKCKSNCIGKSKKLRLRDDAIEDLRSPRINGKQMRRRIVERAVSSKSLELERDQSRGIWVRAPDDSGPQFKSYTGKGQLYYKNWQQKNGADKNLPCDFDKYFTVDQPRHVNVNPFLLQGLGITASTDKRYYSISAKGPMLTLDEDQDIAASFTNDISPKDGVFIAVDNNRGSIGSTNQPAIPYHFSDVAWWQWQKSVRADNPDKDPNSLDYSGLRFFVRSMISNDDTRSIMDKAFQSKNSDGSTAQTFMPDSNQDDSNPFWALLGTPNGNGIIYLLTDYKEAVKGKGIESLTIMNDFGTYLMWATITK